MVSEKSLKEIGWNVSNDWDMCIRFKKGDAMIAVDLSEQKIFWDDCIEWLSFEEIVAICELVNFYRGAWLW